MGALGLWYGQPYAKDSNHNCILSMAIGMQRDTVTRLRTNVSRICTQFLEAENGLHTHQTCHPLRMFGMLWIDVYDSVFQFTPISSNFAQPLKRQHSTGHIQLPDQLSLKETCRDTRDKWRSHRILAGFLIHVPTFSIWCL